MTDDSLREIWDIWILIMMFCTDDSNCVHASLLPVKWMYQLSTGRTICLQNRLILQPATHHDVIKAK
jgi:hypothetical protein